MAQFLYPNSNIGGNPAWVGQYTAIDETGSPNDSDYVYCPNNENRFFIADLSAGTDPQTHGGHIIRVRVAQADSDETTIAPTSGGANTTFDVAFYQGVTLIATLATGVASPEGGFVTQEYTLSEAQAANITNYADLNVRVEGYGSGGNPGNRRGVAVSWIEVEIPDAPPTPGTVPTANIVGYWPLNGVDGNDYSSNGNNGTEAGSGSALTSEAGLFNNATRFTNGQSRYYECGDQSIFSFGNGTTDSAFSVSFLYHCISNSAQNPVFGKGTTARTEYSINLGDRLEFYIRDDSAGAYFVSELNGNPFATNTWFHVVITYDGSGSFTGVNVYIDGIFQTVVDGGTVGTYTAMEDTAGILRIGAGDSNDSTGDFRLQCVGLWNKELTYAEARGVWDTEVTNTTYLISDLSGGGPISHTKNLADTSNISENQSNAVTTPASDTSNISDSISIKVGKGLGETTAITDFGSAWDVDAAAFIDAVQGGGDSLTLAQQEAINNLVVKLKADGLWTKHDAIYPFVGGTATAHKWNLKDPQDLDASHRLTYSTEGTGSITHDANGMEIIATDGSNGAIASTHYGLTDVVSSNDGFIHLYSNKDVTTYANTRGRAIVACSLSGENFHLETPRQTTDDFARFYFENQVIVTDSILDDRGIGHYVGTTDGLDFKIYKNGDVRFTQAKTQPAFVSQSGNLFIGSLGTGGGDAVANALDTYHSSARYSFVGIGSADLTAADNANLYDAVGQFQYELGRAYEPDAEKFIQAVESGGDTLTTAQKVAIDNLVTGLKTNSLWTSFDAIYPFVGGTATSHKWNLKNPLDTNAAYRLSYIISGTGTISHTANGMEIDSPAVSSGGAAWTYYTQDQHTTDGQNFDFTMSLYSPVTSQGVTRGGIQCGYTAPTNNAAISFVPWKDTWAGDYQVFFRMGSSGPNDNSTTWDTSGDTLGCFILTNDNTTQHSAYENGNLINGSPFSSGTRQADHTNLRGFGIGGILNANVANQDTAPISTNFVGGDMCTGTYSFASFGPVSLNATQAGNLTTVIESYQAELGRSYLSGSNLTATPSDTANITDATSIQLGKPLDDTANVTDVISIKLGKSLNDTATTTDNDTPTLTALLDNLAFSYQFEQTTGQLLDDLGNHDSVSTTVTNKGATGYDNNAWEFVGDGTAPDDWVDFGTKTEFMGSNLTELTLMVDFYPTTAGPVSFSNVFGHFNAEAGTHIWNIGYSSANQFRVKIGDPASNHITTGGPYAINTWHRVVIRWTLDGPGRIRVNGGTEETAAANAGTLPTSALTMQIGMNPAYSGAGARYLNGRVDNVMFWTRDLSDAEVDILFSGNPDYRELAGKADLLDTANITDTISIKLGKSLSETSNISDNFSPYDSDAVTFFNAVEGGGDTLTAVEKWAVSTLVTKYKANGTWSKYQAIYPNVGGTASAHKWNLKDPQDTDAAYRITWVGTLTHNSSGTTSDASTGYGNTHKVFTLDDSEGTDFHLQIYVNSNNANVNTDVIEMGNYHHTDPSGIFAGVKQNDTSGDLNMMHGQSRFYLNHTGDARKHLLVTKGGANAETYVNGSLIDSRATTAISNTSSNPIFINGNSNAGQTVYPNGMTNQTIALGAFGQHLTSSEVANDFITVQDYQTKLSREIPLLDIKFDTITVSDNFSTQSGKSWSESDTVTISDSISFAIGKDLSETSNITDNDSYVKNIFVTETDTATFTDSEVKAITSTIDDTASITDNDTEALSIFTTESDTAVISDNESKAATTVANDTATITDQYSDDWVPGGNLTNNQADTTNISDSLSLVVGKNISDSTTISDNEVGVAGKVLGDTTITTDSEAKTVTVEKADTVNITDQYSDDFGGTHSENDTANITESESKAVGKTESDTSTVSEDDSKAVGKADSDTTVITDSEVLSLGKFGTEADTTNVTDADSLLVGLAKDDTTAISDDETFAIGSGQNDTASITDDLSTISETYITISDTAVTTDQYTDDSANPDNYTHLVNETVNISDNQSSASDIFRSENDVVNITDEETIVSQIKLELNDNVSISDSDSEVWNVFRSFNETTNISDSEIIRTPETFRTVDDDVVLSDDSWIAVTTTENDSAVVSDNINASIGYILSIDDNITIIDDDILSLSIVIEETTIISENLVQVWDWVINLNDVVSTIDIITNGIEVDPTYNVLTKNIIGARSKFKKIVGKKSNKINSIIGRKLK